MRLPSFILLVRNVPETCYTQILPLCVVASSRGFGCAVIRIVWQKYKAKEFVCLNATTSGITGSIGKHIFVLDNSFFEEDYRYKISHYNQKEPSKANETTQE